MTLSKEQIDLLFLFVEKKQVRWYDLQTELVDHLANKIEAELEINPNYTFDFALQKVYSAFGIFGFARIVRKKEEQVRKQNNKLWYKEFKNQFVLPNLIRSVALFFIIKILVSIIPFEYILIGGLFVVIFNFLIQIILKKKQSKTTKKLLLTQYYLWPNFLGCIYFQIYIHYWQFDKTGVAITPNNYLKAGIIFIVTISYLASIKVANNIYKKAKIMYPEAFEISN